jgi:cytochrome P450
MTREKALARLKSKVPRADLLDRLTKPDSGVSEAEFIQNCATVVVAGSDTTANVLAGTTHFLAQNRRCYDKLCHEVRSRFHSESEITLAAVNELEYLTACLTEGMRRYPPTPAHLPRRTNMDDYLAGRFVPKDVSLARSFAALYSMGLAINQTVTLHMLLYQTTVSLTQVVMYHTEKYFRRPYDYCPERWLHDPEFASDRREALQAFSYGPRGCIGRKYVTLMSMFKGPDNITRQANLLPYPSLAWIELRLTIARLIWNFDFESVPGYENWHHQNIYLGWQKVPLLIRLRPRACSQK